MMSRKSISGKNLEEAITSDDILGKNVIDKEGKFIGVAEKVFLDKKKLDFIGIGVDKGFLKKGLSVGKGYIKKVTPYAVFLKISVKYEIKGMELFDRDGIKIGRVNGIELFGNKNKLKSIRVSTGVASRFLGKHVEIPVDMIEKVIYNVILNVSKDDLKDRV